jgi:putative ABC transport system ATP-binding protein
MTAPAMIRLDAITRVFRMGDQEVRALDRINLDIAAGEYVSIMGPSGSGKSTLLNVIGLLDHPDGGHYTLDGIDVTTLSEPEQAQVRRTRIGFVFQSFHLVPRLTAAGNIELPLTGPVQSDTAKELATQIAQGVEGVVRVDNQLTVQ